VAKLPVVILVSVISASLLGPQLPAVNTPLEHFGQYTDGDTRPNGAPIATTRKQAIAAKARAAIAFHAL